MVDHQDHRVIRFEAIATLDLHPAEEDVDQAGGPIRT